MEWYKKQCLLHANIVRLKRATLGYSVHCIPHAYSAASPDSWTLRTSFKISIQFKPYMVAIRRLDQVP